MRRISYALLFWGLFSMSLNSAPASAGEASVLKVRTAVSPDGSYRFDVTVRHDDTGWDHYADRWDILDASGNVLASRILLHPHETEQPFTRSLTGVRLPNGISRITIRAHDKIHGNGQVTHTVDLPTKGS